MITIQAEPLRKLIRAQFSGFLRVEEVAEFARAQQALVADMGWASGDFFLLVDSTEAMTFSQEVVSAFQEFIEHSTYKATRIAVVPPNTLTRMQARRILGNRDSAAVFDTVEEAERSLF